MIAVLALLLVACLHCMSAQDITGDPDCWIFKARGRGISGHNDRVLRGIASDDECAQACVSETEFDCASMEYKAKYQKCFLSTSTRESAVDEYGPIHGMQYRERTVPCGEVDPCSPQPCLNGGECADNGGGAYTCTCAAGFGGDTCTEEVDPCFPEPCLNGGQCEDIGAGGYECTCSTGFEGETCAQEVDPCSPQPCLNGGKCEDIGAGAYTCTCPEGFQGDTCTEGVCTGGGPLAELNFNGKCMANVFYGLTFCGAGVVTEWTYYAHTAGTLYLCAWRLVPDTNFRFELIGFNKVVVSEPGLSTYTVPLEERFSVFADDRLGASCDGRLGVLFYEDGVFARTEGGKDAQLEPIGAYFPFDKRDYTVGYTVEGLWNNGTQYRTGAFQATVVKEA